ncbi:MAG TPA: Ig-like domain repeat protein, partial [Gaiellaceae bacterium]|nr:Ig-like domain repeat protein [Gaiellaceae bacterium]
TDAVGNQTGWTATRSFVFDTNPPGTPILGAPSDGSYLSAAPALHATFSSSDAGDSGTVSFQVCSDPACGAGTVQAIGSVSSLTNGMTGSWTPSGLADGLHYWRAQAQDAAGNQSGWSTQSFTLDTTTPSGPSVSGPADGVLLDHTPTLTSSYTDPTTGGETGTLVFEVCSTNACTSVLRSGTVAGLNQNDAASWTPPGLGDGTYYWHVRAEDEAGNLSAWSSVRSFRIDSTAPPAPTLTAGTSLHVNAAPQLGATVIEPTDPGDSARILFELCTDPACASVVGTGYSGFVSVGTATGWQTPPLADGVYYWRALAEDLAGNQSPWSAVGSFVLDTVVPSVPAMVGPAVGAIVNTARLSAVVTGLSRGGGSGLAFQVCADAACTKVVASGYVPVAASGAAPTWTPTGLGDGLYFWRLSAHDQAGNESAWSTTMSFVLDRTPPGKPLGLTAKLKGKTLTLRWKAPSRAAHLAGYVLLVNGRRAGVVTAKTHIVRMKLKKGEARLFAVAAFDAAGNVGRPAIVVGPDLIRLTIKQAHSAASPKAPVRRRRP